MACPVSHSAKVNRPARDRAKGPDPVSWLECVTAKPPEDTGYADLRNSRVEVMSGSLREIIDGLGRRPSGLVQATYRPLVEG